MTSFQAIHDALDGVWDTDATAYDMAWALLRAVGLDDDEIEMEVESVISRALKAREFIDLAKVAAEVAKLLPGEAEAVEPLMIANLKAAIRTGYLQRGPHGCFDFDEEQAAQAVMQLLRKE